MARWGYEKGFTIEHDPTVKKRVSCKDCLYYEKSDHSCSKRPLYLPEDGYDLWKTCKYFELSNQAHHYNEKYAYVESRRKRQSQVVDKNPEKPEKLRFEDFKKIGKYIHVLPLAYLSASKEYEICTVNPNRVRKIKEFYNANGNIDKPVVVTRTGDKYQIVDGYARYRFAKEEGLKEIPVILNTADGKARYDLCKKNTNVLHKTYGDGIVERYDLLYITVRFPNKNHTARFNIDMCIDQGIIQKR